MSDKVKMMMEMVHGPDVCRCQCVRGGACGRPICTGACTLPGNADQVVPAQVYLRWVGKRDGEPFTSMQTGPWGLTVCGNVIDVTEMDMVELERQHDDLARYSHADGLTLQMAEVQIGSVLGEWRPVIPAAAGKADEGSATSVLPAWRDPAVEMPKERVSVIVKVDDDEDPIRAVWHNGHCWLTIHTGMDLIPTVVAWMYPHEAFAILDAAKREVPA